MQLSSGGDEEVHGAKTDLIPVLVEFSIQRGTRHQVTDHDKMH